MLENLTKLRESRNITVQQMAKLLEMDETDYLLFEREGKDIALEKVIALARYFHTSTDYILDFTDQLERHPWRDDFRP